MSEGSSDDESVYSTTNVLLGYASREPTGDEISFLGGSPSWLGDVKPFYELFQCKNCKGSLSQLLQLNGELPEKFPNHDRRLHILGCRRKTCSRKSTSIRALRATRHSAASLAVGSQQQSSKPIKPVVNLGNDIFGTGTTSFAGLNPFSKTSTAPSIDDKTSSTSQPKTTTYSTAAQSNHVPQSQRTHQPWPAEVKGADNFPKLYLDADYESLSDDTTSKVSSNNQMPTLADGMDDENADSSTAKRETEVFESDLDKTFQKFADRLAQNPEQVLRYEFKGQPLLFSATDGIGKMFSKSMNVKTSARSTGPSACPNCGTLRVFELQLTPHAIIELENDNVDLDGMEWGTIIIAVCEANCQARGVESGNVGYLEEWIGVQWEERKK